MRLERVRPQSVQVSLHPLELAGLLTAARWVVNGLRDTPPPEALAQLRLILADYDRQTTGRHPAVPKAPEPTNASEA